MSARLLASIMKAALLTLLSVAAAAQNDSVPEGSRRDLIQPAITGGGEAQPGQFPWQAGIFITLGWWSGVSFCGGSLIYPEWVVTAAHCTFNAKSYQVILGALRIRDVEESQQRFITKEVYIHEDWSLRTLANDIALLRLPKPAELNDFVQVVSLPSRSQLRNNFYKQFVTISGWGRESDDSNKISNILRYASSTVVSNAYCALKYLKPFLLVQGTNICVDGSAGKSTCKGDSGGPLVTKDCLTNDKPVLIGITSFGITLGCEVGWPPAFTRVTSYAQWISDVTSIDLPA